MSAGGGGACSCLVCGWVRVCVGGVRVCVCVWVLERVCVPVRVCGECGRGCASVCACTCVWGACVRVSVCVCVCV